MFCCWSFFCNDQFTTQDHFWNHSSSSWLISSSSWLLNNVLGNGWKMERCETKLINIGKYTYWFNRMVLAWYRLCLNYSNVFVHSMERKFNFYSQHCWPSSVWWVVQRDPLESKKEKSLTEKLKNYECMGYSQAGTEKSRQFKTKLNDFLHEIQALECEEQAQVARFLHGKFLLQLRQQRLGSHSRSWLIPSSCTESACFQSTIILPLILTPRWIKN